MEKKYFESKNQYEVPQCQEVALMQEGATLGKWSGESGRPGQEF